MGIVDAKKKAAAKSKGGKTGIKEVKKAHERGYSKEDLSNNSRSQEEDLSNNSRSPIPRGKMSVKLAGSYLYLPGNYLQ